MAPPLLTLQDIHLTFGGTPLFEGAELSVFERDRLCLVGRNGSGKSTLLKIAAGIVEADSGERFVKPGVTVRYLEQEPDLSAYATVADYAGSGLDAGSDPHRVTYLLEHLGLDGAGDPKTLSGGEMRRAALVRALAPEPDILLLDEPTNHLDLPAIEWLEDELKRERSAVVLISHDRRFLENLSRRTCWIDRGTARTLERGFAEFEPWRDEMLEEEERDRHKLERKIHRENQWVIHGVSGRRKRNQKRLADLHELREEKRRLTARGRDARDTVEMTAAEAKSSGKQVVEAKNISKSWDGTPAISDFSIKIDRGDRIGIIGPNGAGKTTLLRLLTGDLEPDEGTIRFGTRLEVVTLDQKRESLPPTTSLRDALTDGGGDMVMVGDTQRHVVSYMKDFLFRPEQIGTPIEALSGGERGRLMLARAFARPSNLLVLDEPTNDLDLETLDLLQELLADYSGTVFLVSHDRDFLDRIVTSVVAVEGGGASTLYPGGYGYVERTIREREAEAAKAASASAKGPEKDKPGEAAKAQSKSAEKRRLSFKEQYALDTLPGEIAALEKKIAAEQKRLEDPGLYDRDPEGFARTADALAKLQGELAEKEEAWLELEVLREEIEGA
ncbi:ABC-F family ATP-binding cassette domain-containing protein [Rhodobium gokarnense]|uniref:ATP-binding cassette subfamily F protein uup n=1 Tax=Rhodobium gokarnense TaxID=364296 RepID=A0ABT3HE86_9HYPH|nr:ABC-F family ATP-binding cassette domain-containing protein [Rhodobium gokarnense]MCW2308581.1 ATP-binding cassette subfamily F protein uup [Rhodobium gokarnense]